jgi:hypothetical protein
VCLTTDETHNEQAPIFIIADVVSMWLELWVPAWPSKWYVRPEGTRLSEPEGLSDSFACTESSDAAGIWTSPNAEDPICKSTAGKTLLVKTSVVMSCEAKRKMKRWTVDEMP